MSELRSHGTIVPFDLTTGLWVVCRGAHCFGAQHFHYGNEEVRHELGSLGDMLQLAQLEVQVLGRGRIDRVNHLPQRPVQSGGVHAKNCTDVNRATAT